MAAPRNITTLRCPLQYVVPLGRGGRGGELTHTHTHTHTHTFNIIELHDVGSDSSPGIAYLRYVTNLSQPWSCSGMQLVRFFPTQSEFRWRGVKLFFTVKVKQRLRASKNRVLREHIWTKDKESRRRMEKVYVRNFLTCNLRRILLRWWNGEMVGACNTHWRY